MYLKENKKEQKNFLGKNSQKNKKSRTHHEVAEKPLLSTINWENFFSGINDDKQAVLFAYLEEWRIFFSTLNGSHEATLAQIFEQRTTRTLSFKKVASLIEATQGEQENGNGSRRKSVFPGGGAHFFHIRGDKHMAPYQVEDLRKALLRSIVGSRELASSISATKEKLQLLLPKLGIEFRSK
jgi:hypothetical protein